MSKGAKVSLSVATVMMNLKSTRAGTSAWDGEPLPAPVSTLIKRLDV
jgi:hypothetical protein